LRVSGVEDAARAAYIGLLVQDPTEPCALAGIKALDAPKPPTGASCAAADALRDLGYDDEAKAAYVKVLEAGGTSQCAKDGLDELKSRGDRLIAWTEHVGKVFVALLFLIGIAVAVAVTFSYWARRSERRPAPEIRHLRFLVPTLGLESFKRATSTETDGDAFSAALREALATPQVSPGRPYSLNSVIATEGLGETIAKLGEAVAPLKALGAIVSVLQLAKPKASFAVHGTLRTLDSRIAATAFLEETGRSRQADTLMAPPGLDEPLEAVAWAVAGWTQHAIQEVARGATPFQTHTSVSYGFLSAGARAEGLAKAEDARALYVHAIELDGLNGQARIALAILDGEDPEQGLKASDSALLGASAIEAGAQAWP